MDRKHKLDAPNNESLKHIEQFGDRSELSTLYPRRGKQWDGDLVSPEERDRRRQKKDETLSFGIRKQFWLVGLLTPLPLVILSLFIGVIFAIATEDNIPQLVIPGMFLFFIWMMLLYGIMRKTNEVFYRHSLRAIPYIVTLVILLALSVQSIYLLTIPLHSEQLVASLALVGAIELGWSILISYGLIFLWTTPRLSGNTKMSLIAVFAAALLGVSVLLTIAHL